MSAVKSFDAKVIEITLGNTRNSHIYLASAENLIPEDAFGGSDASDPGKPINVRFLGGTGLLIEEIETDLPADKKILRARSTVTRFFKAAGVEAGNFILFTKLGERIFEVRKL